ncbi:efflux RND transporter periplasmic adaptor subunit [Cellulomonas bogoriensis]|uniref:Peptidoglycan-binding protein n=1 Tax=Cellulomonas bogoriensis 69B4 = DSM 16987 TaxID=1386082 RepID=A0A0A0C1Z6_9CELL|nr:hypothetical protein [Cellulomonas bogoriensis]KGM14012.1 hypothetical protein N869_06575 [Cellulomonas bogoriensis 69B4 = DSM 16987]
MRRLPPAGSTRTIWVIGGTAVLSLGIGLGLGQMIESPAEAAARTEPPPAGPITVPVEERTLENEVVLRGDAVYEDPVDVTVEVADLGGPAVVTGQVPEVGDTVDAGEVVLEVTGRPVVLLEGDLPVYRTLRAGMSGPDVVQLKKALRALDIASGDPESDVYDAQTASGVRALYEEVGYPAPTAGEEAQAALEAAQSGVRDAEESLAAAQREASSTGTPRSERLRLQAEVDGAKHRLAEARRACERPTEERPCDRGAVIEAQGALNVAEAARDEGQTPPDASLARSAVDSAGRVLEEARRELVKAQTAVLTPLPAGEVVFLDQTPRRVDSVEVRRGVPISGSSVMSVSGATLQIAGTVTRVDADLLETGSTAWVTLPGGEEVEAELASVGEEAAGSAAQEGESTGSGRVRVVVEPTDLTRDQREELQGANVRVRIPVSSTGGDVLAVPIAALTAGPGGEARVEVLRDGETVLVTVEPGLAAGGFVAVEPVDGTLSAGDRVVVGQGHDLLDVGDREAQDPGDPDEPSDEQAPQVEDTDADTGTDAEEPAEDEG